MTDPPDPQHPFGGGRASRPSVDSEDDEATRLVRPYSITGGRTEIRYQLAVEAMVIALEPRDLSVLAPEVQAILAFCREWRSVAEISAVLRLPLGVARILVADMAADGLVRIHQRDDAEDRPDLHLLQRVLSGIRRQDVGESEDEPAASIAELTIPISIFLSEAESHADVEAAIAGLLTAAGLRIESFDDPVHGSWFRRMRAAVDRTAPAVAREGALIATHIADSHLVLAQDAAITATLMQNLGPVITSLQPTKDAVVRIGALLIVKVDWAVSIHQLTAAQQAKLDHQAHLSTAPHEIIAALGIQHSGGADTEAEQSGIDNMRPDAIMHREQTRARRTMEL